MEWVFFFFTYYDKTGVSILGYKYHYCLDEPLPVPVSLAVPLGTCNTTIAGVQRLPTLVLVD